MMPLNEVAFFIEALQAVAVFEKTGGTVDKIAFRLGDRQLFATRVK